jgi:hypothetical protein
MWALAGTLAHFATSTDEPALTRRAGARGRAQARFFSAGRQASTPQLTRGGGLKVARPTRFTLCPGLRRSQGSLASGPSVRGGGGPGGRPRLDRRATARPRSSRPGEDLGLLGVEPLADQREPCFVRRLLRAEQQPVPVRAVRLQMSHPEAIPFGRCRDKVQDAIGKRRVGLGVDADGGDPGEGTDRGRRVTRAVRHAALHPGRPGGCAADARQDRNPRITQPP